MKYCIGNIEADPDFLEHHGILGMKWGQRNGPPYPLGSSDHSAAEKKAGWRKSLNDFGQRQKKISNKISKHVNPTIKKVVKKAYNNALERGKKDLKHPVLSYTRDAVVTATIPAMSTTIGLGAALVTGMFTANPAAGMAAQSIASKAVIGSYAFMVGKSQVENIIAFEDIARRKITGK